LETPDELTAFLTAATVDGILGRLLYRGAAWSLMREAGVLPQNAPPLGATIETDLAEHGFALLRGAMALRAKTGASDLTNKAFERAANAFEALVRNGNPESPDRGFRRTIAASAYHLAGYSAVAYSLFNETSEDLNTAPGETAIRHLILRDLDKLRGFVREWLDDEAHGDEQVAEVLRGEEPDIDEVLSAILNTTICRALAHFDFALETGEPEPIDSARTLLATAVSLADNAENVPLWWISNLCRHLIDDLWLHSLHQNLPTEPPEGTEENTRTCADCSSRLSMPENFRSGAMAIAARSGPAFNGRHRRLGRRLADQCWQNAGCGDCCANDLVVRAPGTDRHTIARIVRPDGALLQKDLRASRLQRLLALRRQRSFGW